jgi:hypothetical protein
VKSDGQFNVVWKTPGPVKAKPWSPFIDGNDKKKDEPDGKSKIGPAVPPSPSGGGLGWGRPGVPRAPALLPGGNGREAGR